MGLRGMVYSEALRHGTGGGGSASVFEAPAGVAGLDDVAVMGQAIEHCGGHPGVAEHLGPIGEGEVGGDQQRGVLVELADQVEQQLPAGLAERQVAELVDDDEIVAQQLLGQAAAAAGGLLLLELVDQIDEVEEPAPGADADDRRGDGDAEMRFARAGSADEDRVAPGVEKAAGRKLAQLALVDRRVGKDELVEILEHREPGAGDAIADRPSLAVGPLGPDQAGDNGKDLVAPASTAASPWSSTAPSTLTNWPARRSARSGSARAAWGGTAGRADCRPGSRPAPSPSRRRACRPPVRSGGASTSAESAGCTAAPCR